MKARLYPWSLAATALLLFSAVSSTALAADWPQMGGPLGRHASEEPALPPGWTGKDAKIVWRVKLTNPGNPGQVAAAGGEVFLLDQTPEADRTILRVLALEDGRELWRIAWPTPAGNNVETKRPFGMPAVTDEHVYVVGPPPPDAVEEGKDPRRVPLRAVDRKTHQDAWVFEPASVGGHVTRYASPHVEGSLVLVSAEGEGGEWLVAVDRLTGRHAWTCKLPYEGGFKGRLMNAPQAATLDGVRQIVVHHDSGVSGVDLEGKLLWHWNGYKRGTLTATPTVAPDGHVYVSSGHEGSSGLVRVTRADGKWTCTTVYSDPGAEAARKKYGRMPHKISGNGNVTSAAWWDGCFHAVGQDGLHCMRSDGTFAWTSRESGRDRMPQKRGRCASPSTVALSGNVLTYRGGHLVIARAGGEEFRLLAAVEINQKETPSQLACVDGRVLIRCDDIAGRGRGGDKAYDDGVLVCVDLRGKHEERRTTDAAPSVQEAEERD